MKRNKKNAQGAGTIRKRFYGRWEARFTIGFDPVNGKSALDAHFEVSRLLGHERPDVTNIYLASVRKSDKHEQ